MRQECGSWLLDLLLRPHASGDVVEAGCRARDTSAGSEPGGVTLSCVLVVEDDPWIQWMIADDLTDRNYDVKTASDGVEALAQLAEVRPDVIVLDLILPRSSGWDVV